MRGTYIKPAALGLLIVLALCSCGKKATDEELIRAAINRAAEAAEAKDTAGIMKLVSKDYRDDNGLDYNGIKGVLFGEFFRPGKIKVFVTGVTVEVKGEKALVTAKAALVRGVTPFKGKDVKSIKDILSENADAFRFTLIFKKEGGEWKLVNASWESISVAGLL
ncbi:MAG: nuclear transport factor 2 family protein [Deltaproteobacteria bacterium]|nr:nuclear transport factor 2 family protein [Deltaproteobacteria bacterium]